MTLSEIKKLIQKDESITLEFKSSTGQLKGALQSLCAFLNTNGGTVIIGVKQNGDIIGQKVSDNTQQEIANELSKIEPHPESVKVEYVPLNNNEHTSLIIISTIRGNHTPYAYDGRAFYRNQSTTKPMPQSRYSQLLLERGSHLHNSWDMQCVNNVTIDDLDHDEINKTVKIAVNANRLDPQALSELPEDILMRLELINHNKLTNAAVLLFSKSIKSHLPQCCIKMARFIGPDEADGFIDNQTICGNIFTIMKSANEFIMKHLSVTSFFDENKLERIDQPVLPVLAIREALSNAICHRDYSVSNASITLAIFNDRMEIWNNGTLPSSLTIADLKKKHKSYPRNKKISQIFYLRRYVESWGTGTTKMIQLCRKHNIPDPLFEEYSGGVSVTFKFSNEVQQDSGNAFTPEKRRENIVSMLKKSKPMTSKEIHNRLIKKASLRTTKQDLSALEKQGAVKKEGKGKNTLWRAT